MQQAILFARNFFKHPAMLGSIIPSSRFVTARLVRRIAFEHAKVIVEYGPGIGNISEAVLKCLRPESRLVLVEMNGDFVRHLDAKFAKDKRVAVVQGSAGDVEAILEKLGIPCADYILSGIPFSTIPEKDRREILSASRSVLAQNGELLVYQFTRAVLPHLKATFTSVNEEFELLNVLPARLFYCNAAASGD